MHHVLHSLSGAQCEVHKACLSHTVVSFVVLKACSCFVSREDVWIDCRVYNMGGPERLSRKDFADKVAETWNYSKHSIIPASSSSINRGFCSPADISMDSGRLTEELDVQFTPFQEALAKMGRPLQRVSSARNSREAPRESNK